MNSELGHSSALSLLRHLEAIEEKHVIRANELLQRKRLRKVESVRAAGTGGCSEDDQKDLIGRLVEQGAEFQPPPLPEAACPALPGIRLRLALTRSLGRSV